MINILILLGVGALLFYALISALQSRLFEKQKTVSETMIRLSEDVVFLGKMHEDWAWSYKATNGEKQWRINIQVREIEKETEDGTQL
jgi:hypothetical protein